MSGKVKRIARTPGSTKPELVFAYGADGQRISKQVGEPTSGGHKEYYIRDASGNIMATYRYLLNPVPNTNPPEYESSLKLTERPIYGSSRIGSHTRQMEMVGSTPPQYYPYTQPMPAPKKRYELTDHLGNVNTVVSGKLLPMPGGGFQAEVVSAQGYEAFGSLLPGRNYSSGSYRFGFQGQEKDNEVYGSEGTSYTAEFWQYDVRTAQRWNIDPVVKPWESPYATFRRNPIWYVDVNGDDPSTHTDEDGNVIAVKEDGDLGVYKHSGKGNEALKNFEQKYSSTNTSAGGTKMGETEHIDEFINPETGIAMKEVRIRFGESFDDVISKHRKMASDMSLPKVAKESGPGGLFDIKKDFPNKGRLLNNKYATSRSAGNYLAGINANGGGRIARIDFDAFQRLAGTLHVRNEMGVRFNTAHKVLTMFGFVQAGVSSPTHGENTYQYRMSKAGYEAGAAEGRSKWFNLQK